MVFQVYVGPGGRATPSKLYALGPLALPSKMLVANFVYTVMTSFEKKRGMQRLQDNNIA